LRLTNLKNLELQSEIVARVTQTTRRHKAVTIGPQQNGLRNWTMVSPDKIDQSK